MPGRLAFVGIAPWFMLSGSGAREKMPAHVYAYRFGSVIAIWWDWWNEPEQTDKTVSLRMTVDARVTSAITDRAGTRRTWDLRPSGGQVEFKLGKEPLFIEEK